MLWRDLHINLDEDVADKPAMPELTVKGISFEREIGDKLWKISSPQTYKDGQLISATNLDAHVEGKNEHTIITAKSGSYHMTDQVFNFVDARLSSRQVDNTYNMSANSLTYEAKNKKWKLNGSVSANSKELTIKTGSAVLLENKKTCEMPNGGKIIWKEKK